MELYIYYIIIFIYYFLENILIYEKLNIEKN